MHQELYVILTVHVYNSQSNLKGIGFITVLDENTDEFYRWEY